MLGYKIGAVCERTGLGIPECSCADCGHRMLADNAAPPARAVPPVWAEALQSLRGRRLPRPTGWKE